MKFLLLMFVLVSCGHKEPGALDLQDDDGDSIANQYEADSSRFIANIAPLPKIEGILEIVHSGGKFRVKVSNFDVKPQDTYAILTQDFFENEKLVWFRELGLKLGSFNPHSIPDEEIVDLTFSFLPDTPAFENFSYWSKEGVVSLGRLEHGTRISLKGLEVKRISIDRGWFELNRSRDEMALKDRIADSTRRVFVDHNGKTEIYYVAENLSIENLATYLGISGKLEKITTNEFLFKNDAIKSWWYRDEGNGTDAALRFGKVEEFKGGVLDSLKWKDFSLTRVEGQPQGAMKIDLKGKNPGDLKKVFIIFSQTSAAHAIRSFQQDWKSITWDSNRGEVMRTCNYLTRWISGVNSSFVNFDKLVENLQVRLDGKEIDITKVIEYYEAQDRDGRRFFEVSISVGGGELEFALKPSSYGTDFTGIFNSECNSRRKNETTPVSVEARLEFHMAVTQLQ